MYSETEIKEMLNDLTDLKAATGVIELDRQEARAKVLTPEQQRQLDDIDAEFAEHEQAIAEKGKELQERIKAAVIENGATVKGDGLQAVYGKPRISYDPRALDGLLITMPELAAFRKESKPSVSIRVVK